MHNRAALLLPPNVVDLAKERERRAPFDPIKARAQLVRDLMRAGSNAYYAALVAIDAGDRGKGEALIDAAERAFAMASEILAELEVTND
jgi:hypothetical protein